MYVDMVNTTNTRCNLRGLIKFKVRPSVPSFFLLFLSCVCACRPTLPPSPCPSYRPPLSCVCARVSSPPPVRIPSDGTSLVCVLTPPPPSACRLEDGTGRALPVHLRWRIHHQHTYAHHRIH